MVGGTQNRRGFALPSACVASLLGLGGTQNRIPPYGGSCGRHRGMPPVPPGASRRGLCPPPPSPRAGPAIGAMRSPLEGQRHGQGSTGALRPGDTCRGSAPAPGPAGRALWHGTRGGRARDEAMAGPGGAGLDDGGRLELGGRLALGPGRPLGQRGNISRRGSSRPLFLVWGARTRTPLPPASQRWERQRFCQSGIRHILPRCARSGIPFPVDRGRPLRRSARVMM